MKRINLRVFLLVVAAMGFASVLSAQQTIDLPPVDIPLPDATVGVPYSASFSDDLSSQLEQISNLGGSGISLTYGFTAAGTLPPGLSLKSSGQISGTPTKAGSYKVSAQFTMTLSVAGTVALSSSFTINYTANGTLNVAAASGPAVNVAPPGLVFSAVQGAQGPLAQSLTISSSGAQIQTYTTSAQGGTWLSVAGGGNLPAFSSASIAVAADPTGLQAGTYNGTVTVSVPGLPSIQVPVLLVISATQQGIVLTQSGFTFTAVAGGGSEPTQRFGVLPKGVGTLDWTASSSVLSGGSWLSISATSGRSTRTATSVSDVDVVVTANPTGLAAGTYYGTVQVAAKGVANSPQTMSVVLNVLPATTKLDPVILPTGMVFVATSGGAAPAAQKVTVTNVTTSAYTVNPAVFTDNGGNWLTVQGSGTAVANQPLTLTVQPNATGLAPGVYLGEVDLRLLELNSIRPVAVLLVVLPAGTIIPGSLQPRITGCTPKALYPVSTALGGGFTSTAGWPSILDIYVVDDCGQPMISGAVVAAFSSGDPPLALTSTLDGHWTGTWNPRNQTTAQVTITLRAQETAPPLLGTSQIGGNVAANTSTPVISAGGAVSAASFLGQQPLAPGAYTAVFGTQLASGLNIAPSLPLGNSLAGTEVFVAGEQVPIYFTSDKQINLILPYDVPPNTTQQLLVRNGSAFSVPEPISIAAAVPAVFTQDASGSGPGIMAGFNADFSQPFLITAAHPVSAGSVIVIYCAGLGQVDQPVTAGAPSPSSPPLANTVNKVTVTIGGQPAQVNFSGLAPGFAGVYQLNVVVPTGAGTGPAVPVVVTVAGQSSPPVTIALQ